MLTPDKLAELRAYVDATAANNGVSPGTELATHLLDHIDAQAARIAELGRDAATRDAELARLLPGVFYMDAPDGGDVPLLEQLRRMARDAARYRWLTQDAHIGECFTDRGVVLEICGTDREIPVLHERATDRDEVDAAIDAAMEQQCTS
ncbi:Uncharacterized protein ChrSV_2323 [Chromobacterium vaccinii]|nr:Uncharacterized protein ChrSW_2323 [Chromobacterium vaccinii]QND89780.1 Uncharacterized protein ChrSV_2323 [Chromobacterium vaccinii]